MPINTEAKIKSKPIEYKCFSCYKKNLSLEFIVSVVGRSSANKRIHIIYIFS